MSKSHGAARLAVIVLLSVANHVQGGEVVFDFEGGDLQGWRVVHGVVEAPVYRYGGKNQRPASGGGDCFLSTSGIAAGREGPDAERLSGVLESALFVIDGDEATFFLANRGGGRAIACALCDESGNELLRENQHGSGAWREVRWDVSRFKGRTVFLRLVDRPESGYDFIALDNFRVEGRIDEAATARRIAALEKEKEASLAPVEKALSRYEKIVFAVRQPGKNGHYYVNFGNWCGNPTKWEYGRGGRLCMLDIESGDIDTLIDDPQGAVRDLQVSYDGSKILFSYRPGRTHRYHLYEISVDGENLRQLTDGPYDDIEPTYLPSGEIMFCSTRCNRIINCNLVEAAVLFTCDANGGNIRQISSNNETENTPWPLPDGRIMFTRWEYIERGIGGFKALWAINPDGTRVATLYGNMHPGGTRLDAKPIPGTSRVVFSDSVHMGREHVGTVATYDIKHGPDEIGAERTISWECDCRDPYPIDDKGFLVAIGGRLVLMSNNGQVRTLHELSEADRVAGRWIHEPRVVTPRPREPVIPKQIDLTKKTGTLVLTDIYEGRNLPGVERGDIKKLLIVEPLPKPVNFSGNPRPYGYNNTFTLERVVGTVPVEADGSASMELPAMRSFLFVALDENDLAIKKMQSFVTVQPGETTSCVGCHEQRERTPLTGASSNLAAMGRPPSRIKPIAGGPRIFDFPRDIQPILDRHCVTCHDYEATERGGPRAGGVILSGDHGPSFSHSFATLHLRGEVAQDRTGEGNRPPYTVGSGASPLMEKLDGEHYEAELSAEEIATIRLWIDGGANYAGTYAASGTGELRNAHGTDHSLKIAPNRPWPARRDAEQAIAQRCASCHAGERRLPTHPLDEVGTHGLGFVVNDESFSRRVSEELVFNLTRPEKSLMLLAPLSEKAGGYGICRMPQGTSVFQGSEDADYQAILQMIRDCAEVLQTIKRFDMPGFRPMKDYVRELKEMDVLPPNASPATVDVYQTDEAYFRSFWVP